MSDPFGFSQADEMNQEPDLGMVPPPAFDHLPAGTGMLQIRGSYSTAVKVERKREINEVNRRLIEEATLMGESAFYGWGAGKDRIEGPSQELALAAARLWGNCAIEVAPIQETADSWVLTTYFIDLETGFTMGRPFRMSKKWTVHGKMDPERKADVRFQIGATKSARNVVLKAIPGWMIDRALDAAKAGVRKKIEQYIERKGIAAAQDAALGVLLKSGVKEAQVLFKFGVAERKALLVDHLIIIQGDIRAIQAGEARPEELYPDPAAEAPKASDILGKKDAGSGNGASEPATGQAPPLPAEGEKLSPEQVAKIRAQAAKDGVSFEAVEEAFEGPLAEYSAPGRSRDDVFADALRVITGLVEDAKLQTVATDREPPAESLFNDPSAAASKAKK